MTEQNQTHPDADSYDPGASSLAGQVDPAVMAELLSIRSSIDNIDATLVYLLAERFKATQKVGFLKATHKLPAGDPGRETAQIARLRRLAAEAHLDPAFAEKFLNFIIGEVIRHHEAIAEDHEASLAADSLPAGTLAADALAAGNQAADAGRSGSAGHVPGAAGPAVSATA
ncbi:chorismate mutase [Arthrobacter sp. AL12]|uniref:chorismate mutase n=2 Tax=unclassified Arthrobacter TaxID=235627 RepID=UPI00249C20DF|nr:chorismate mutase [Arthrobacter sp. AL12]MDI3212546.1 chorismate mutase [Arthrobacter sp. AL12]